MPASRMPERLRQRSRSSRSFVIVLTLAAASAIAAGADVPIAGTPARAAEPETTELKLSVAAGPALPLGSAAERWAQLLTERGEPRLKTKVHAGASLAGRDPAREFGALKEGAADLAVGSALQWSLQVAALGVFSLPWIAADYESLSDVVADEALGEVLRQRLEQQGVVLIALGSLGHRALTTSSRAVRAPADLAGLRVRASPLPLVHEMFLALQAVPQAMGFAQAQAALANGTLDGQEAAPSALAMARSGAGGQRHLTLWGATGDAMVFAIRKPRWDAMSHAERDVLRATAAQAIAETEVQKREEAALRKLSQNGMAIVRITPAGHDAFRDAVRDMLARWREAIGTEVVELAEKRVAERRRSPPGGS